jgi:hypothetical protein
VDTGAAPLTAGAIALMSATSCASRLMLRPFAPAARLRVFDGLNDHAKNHESRTPDVGGDWALACSGIKTALSEIDPSQPLREIFRPRLNDLVGFLQRVDDLVFLVHGLPAHLE